MLYLVFLVGIILLAWIVNLYIFPIKIPTVAGAPIMAIGVVILGVFKGVFFSAIISNILFYSILILTVWIMVQYVLDVVKGEFYSSHIEDPISSFSMGTWVAALSVLTVLFLKQHFYNLSYIIFYFNLFLWVSFLVLIIRNYIRIFKSFKSYILRIHGGVLLSCVSTQSVVISGLNIFGTSFPKTCALIINAIGILFYLINFGLILNRYIKLRSKELTESWENANCIIHGAVSITGVSLTFLFSEPYFIINIVWCIALTFFIIVEVIEIFRGVQRIKKLGWKQGVFTYSSSQWARIFTFGMFLFFTERTTTSGNWFNAAIQNWITLVLGVFLLFLVLIEMALLCSEVYTKFILKENKRVQFIEKNNTNF